VYQLLISCNTAVTLEICREWQQVATRYRAKYRHWQRQIEIAKSQISSRELTEECKKYKTVLSPSKGSLLEI